MATQGQINWLNSFNGHHERMWERIKRFKPRKGVKCRTFHMIYTTKAGKVKFKLITNKKN